MKKTFFIVAFATILATTTSAAELMMELKVVDGALKAFDADGAQLDNVGITTWESVINSDGTINSSDSSVKVDLTSLGISTANGWRVTFDAKMGEWSGDYPVLFGVRSSAGTNNADFKAIWNAQDSAQYWSINPDGNNFSITQIETENKGVCNKNEDKFQSYTLTYYGNDTDKVELYQGDTLVATATVGSDFSDTDILNELRLGERPLNGNGMNYTTFQNVKLFSVPEPTTASLSLLALAGLAVRRRRK